MKVKESWGLTACSDLWETNCESPPESLTNKSLLSRSTIRTALNFPERTTLIEPHRTSQRRQIARHGIALAVAERLHEFRHVAIVGPLAGGEAAHRGDQVVVAEPG